MAATSPPGHHLFQERQTRSVTANTRADAREFPTFAAVHRLRVSTWAYPLDHADRALEDLAADRVNGAGVLVTRRVQNLVGCRGERTGTASMILAGSCAVTTTQATRAVASVAMPLDAHPC